VQSYCFRCDPACACCSSLCLVTQVTPCCCQYCCRCSSQLHGTFLPTATDAGSSSSSNGDAQASSSQEQQQPQEHEGLRLINPSRRSMMLVVPMVAAAAAAAGSAQAADVDLENKCLECAGIGIVPCKLAQSYSNYPMHGPSYACCYIMLLLRRA
jgi:hypothetical protein